MRKAPRRNESGGALLYRSRDARRSWGQDGQHLLNRGVHLSTRQFIGFVGVVLIAIAATGLLWGLTISEPSPLGSPRTINCGSALLIEPMDGSSKLGGAHAEWATDRCSDKATTRRLIFWPVGAVGVIALAGAALVKPSRKVEAS